MENRRQTPNTPNTFNRNKNFRKEGEKSFGYGKYQNRDRKFQPRGENKFQKSDGFQPRDGKFVKRSDGKFFSKNDKFQPKRNFPQKGKKFQPWKKRKQHPDRFGYVGHGRQTQGQISAKHAFSERSAISQAEPESCFQDSLPSHPRQAISRLVRRHRRRRH